MTLGVLPRQEIPRRFSTALACLFGILAITYPVAWLLAPVALAVFFASLIHTASRRSAFAHAFAFGISMSGAGTWWFWDTLPLDWMGVAENRQWYYVLASWGAVTLVCGAASAVVSLGIWHIRTHALLPLGAALLWVLAEDFKMWAFALLTYEERSLMGPHFSSTALGYALAENTYLLQIAEFGGLYFLTFVTALTGALLAIWCTRRIQTQTTQVRMGLMFSFVVLLGFLAYPLVQQPREYPSEPLTLALYASNYELGELTDTGTAEYVKALTTVAQEVPDADIVILPEEVHLEPTFKDEKEKRLALAEIFPNKEVLIVSSDHQLDGRTFSLVLNYALTSGERLGSYSKMFLMPAGEYLPYYLSFAFSLLPDQGLGTYANTLKTRMMPGTEVVAVPFKGWTLGGFICSDFLSPHLYRDVASKYGANVFITSANPAWFHYSPSLHDKTLQIAKVHAVQSRAYFLAASNGAPSFAIDPRGHLIAATPWHFTGALRVNIP